MGLWVQLKVMARSGYISENLTSRQLEFLKFLDHQELDLFSLDELRDMPHINHNDLNEVLENLAHKGLISRIEKGKYCRHNFRDDLAIGNFLVPEGAVAYWSALNIHGLTEHFPNTIFIQSTRQKKEKTIFGVNYTFVQVIPRKIIGIEVRGYGKRQYRLTNKEKTIVDCFDQPLYSGGYNELMTAFSIQEFSPELLIEYALAVGNKACIKRMGFLAETTAPKTLKKFIQFAKQQVNNKYNLFDPTGTDTGEFIGDWRLRLNIPREQILQIVQCKDQ